MSKRNIKSFDSKNVGREEKVSDHISKPRKKDKQSVLPKKLLENVTKLTQEKYMYTHSQQFMEAHSSAHNRTEISSEDSIADSDVDQGISSSEKNILDEHSHLVIPPTSDVSSTNSKEVTSKVSPLVCSSCEPLLFLEDKLPVVDDKLKVADEKKETGAKVTVDISEGSFLGNISFAESDTDVIEEQKANEKIVCGSEDTDLGLSCLFSGT